VWHFPGLQDGRPARHHGVVDFRLRRAATRADLPGLLRRALRGRDPALAAGAFARHPIRWFAPDVPIARPGVLLVGDAAGIEPALGGGLHLALAYGALAAGQLQAAFDRGDFTFQDYPAALQADAVGRHIADFSRLAQTIYSGRQNPLDAVRDFFTARLMRRQLAALLRGRA
jgi:flavin-dependent dehydrogenase